MGKIVTIIRIVGDGEESRYAERSREYPERASREGTHGA
jgi:hypothetical protein